MSVGPGVPGTPGEEPSGPASEKEQVDAGPVRTCIGCRLRASRSALVRWVLVDGVRTRDERACLPGRGAWTHDDPACLELADRRRAWGRALRMA